MSKGCLTLDSLTDCWTGNQDCWSSSEVLDGQRQSCSGIQRKYTECCGMQQDLLRWKEVVRLLRQTFGLPVTQYKVQKVGIGASSIELIRNGIGVIIRVTFIFCLSCLVSYHFAVLVSKLTHISWFVLMILTEFGRLWSTTFVTYCLLTGPLHTHESYYKAHWMSQLPK